MWDCSISTYFDNGTCYNCKTGCSTCRNQYNCNVCKNSLCSGCTDYYNCTTCVSYASIVANVCECNQGYYSSYDTSGNGVCRKSGACISGVPSYTIQECCYSSCPAGFTLNGTNCELKSLTALDFLNNNLVRSQFKDLYENTLVILSPPYPFYQRGYYMYSGCYIHTSTVMLSYNITIQF